MIQVANTIISEDIIDCDFVCNLNACKGACCIEGDAGAPVEESELKVMKRIYPEVAPYLTEEGRTAIEQAYNDKKIDWKKPISCHLYPIRLQEYSSFTAVNYHRWSPICDDACVLGKKLQVPIYKFVKEALIRKFGEEWYQELELIAEHLKK